MTHPANLDTLPDLTWLRHRLPDLRAALTPGTPRPWRQPHDLTPERLHELATQAHADRTLADHRAPGTHPAPLHVGILDLIAHVTLELDTAHGLLAQAIGHPRLPAAASLGDDPTRFIDYLLELIHEAPPQVREAIDTIAADLRGRVATELGEIVDGQTLNAICPFCIGRTPTNPVGGARTLRLRLVPAGDPRDPHATEPLVVCESGDCRPFTNECSHWRGRHPAWRIPEWEWLADRLLSVDVVAGATRRRAS